MESKSESVYRKLKCIWKVKVGVESESVYGKLKCIWKVKVDMESESGCGSGSEKEYRGCLANVIMAGGWMRAIYFPPRGSSNNTFSSQSEKRKKD